MKVLTQKISRSHRFTKPIVVYRGENAAYEFIRAILKRV